jgi:hypothetical protein
MRILFRALLPAFLVALVVALIFLRIISHRGFYLKVAPPPPVADRSATNPLNMPGGGPAPADAYEVYSALYREPADEPLVFSNDSVTDIPQVNGSCLRPSTPEERELTAAFEAANRQTHRWEQNFSIPQGYRLIARSEASDAQNCLQTHMQDAARCEPYKQIRHVRFLGVPGFDHSRTHALVSVVRMCGRYCGNGGIFEVEKTAETWRRSGPSDFTRECSWMY